MKDILPTKYLEHWDLFCSTMLLLNQYSINRDLLSIIDESIQLFVVQAGIYFLIFYNLEQLYGSEVIKINLHQLLHLKTDIDN